MFANIDGIYDDDINMYTMELNFNKILNYKYPIHKVLNDIYTFNNEMTISPNEILNIVKKLVDSKLPKCDVNYPDILGIPPLYMACTIHSKYEYYASYYIPVILYLISSNADMNFKNIHNKSTCLHLLCSYNCNKYEKLCDEIINEFLKHPIDINAQDIIGLTPLHISCIRGNTNVIKLLLEHGTNPNIQENDGNTPAMLCYQQYFNTDHSHHLNNIHLLINYSADISIKNKNNESLIINNGNISLFTDDEL